MPELFVTRTLPIDDVQALAGDDVDVRVFAGSSPPSREELLARAAGADGLLTFLSDAVDGSLLDALPTVRVVANFAVGYDNIDVAACTERGVFVTNTPDVLTEATADMAFALLLAVARRLREGERMVRSGAFEGWSPTMLLGTELHGRTLGIFGPGRIGRAVARRAEGFGMRVLLSGRPGGASGGASVDFETLLAESDVLSIHAPLTSDTHHAFDAAALGRMKRGALIINTARGPIIDEEALVAALEAGHIGGAGLDVFEHEPAVHQGLLERDDVVLAPHLGSATRETRRRMAVLAVRNAVAVLRGQRPENAVNLP